MEKVSRTITSFHSILPKNAFITVATQWPLAVWAIAHSFLVVSFIIILTLASGQANAAQETARNCNPKNLIEFYKDSDPELIAEIETAAAKVINGNAVFWKIEKQGTKPSWLLGTIHVGEPRILAKLDELKSYLDKADPIIIESTDVLDPAKMQQSILANPNLTMMPNGTTLKSLLSETDYAYLETALNKRGIPIGLIGKMQPLMITAMIVTSSCSIASAGDDKTFLDRKIALDAREDGKNVVGLETAVEQLSALASMPPKLQASGLVETLRMGNTIDDLMHTMMEIYLSGHIAKIKPFTSAISQKFGGNAKDTKESMVEFEEKIIFQRNVNMVERSLKYITKGNAFIAVGALHLPGERGIIALLKKHGYTVNPVQP